MDAHAPPIAIATRLIKMVLMMVIFIPSSQCFVFDLHSGRTKCISEELRVLAVTVGNYKILVDPPHNHNISARVNGPDGYSIHKAESVDSGEFAFTVTQPGEHTICFWTPYFNLSTNFPIEFVWKTGFPSKDWAALAKKDKLDENKRANSSSESVN
ncbi:hypothetical protein ACLOJK_000748 [Asimina triloba]